MYAVHLFLVGVAVIHVALVLVYLAGSILRPLSATTRDSTNPAIDFAITTGLGIAAIGLAVTAALSLVVVLTLNWLKDSFSPRSGPMVSQAASQPSQP